MESWQGLSLNREKTRIVDLRRESLDFLGFTVVLAEDSFGRGHRYVRVSPSKKSLAREREAVRELTCSRQNRKPVVQMVGELNRHLTGWSNYYRFGHPRAAFRKINWFVNCRMTRHLARRSQRKQRLPEGESVYAYLNGLGLVSL